MNRPDKTASGNSRHLTLAVPIILGLVFVPAVLLIVAWEMQREFAREKVLREAVLHSYQERFQLQTVFSLLQDVETGQRGYVITGRGDFLRPYVVATQRLDDEFSRLEDLQRSELTTELGGEAGELDDLARLKVLLDRRLAITQQSIELRRRNGFEAAADVMAQGHGKAVMDEIRTLVAQMTKQEAQALAQRTRDHVAAAKRAQQVTQGLFLGLGLLLLLAFFMTLRQWVRSQQLLSQVQATAARQTAIFESAQDALLTFNPSGTIESLNKAGETMFGSPRTELIRRDLTRLLDVPDTGDLFLERLSRGGDLRQGLMLELTAKRTDGSTFPVEASFGVFSLGESQHVVVSIRDISERRRVDRLKSEFISTVSHELRTPLTSIAGSLGLLSGGAAGALPERAERLLNIAHANSRRLVRLINDILDMEKIESGQMTFAMTSLELGGLTRRAVDSMSGLASEYGVRFDVRAEDEIPPVHGDSDRLTQVIANLLSNAAKFSPAGGVVEVSVQPAGAGRVRVSVRDHGHGVPSDFHDRIFSKFAQADASDTRQKGGTGLGLAISREIVERHGGRLWFENLSPGAVFHVELPVLAAGGERSERRPCVLLCEDDADVAEILRQLLDQEGFAVDWVSTLAACEAKLQSEAFTALVLDIHLPDGSGLDLLKRLRVEAETRSLPVLIVSGEPGGGQAQALQVVDWLQKPIDIDRLRAALVAAAAEGAAERPLVLHVEDDMDIRQVVADALSSCCEVVGADSLAEARRLLATLEPALAILDIALGDGSGLELLPALQGAGGRKTPVIIFSAQSVDDASLTASVDAVLTKSRTSLEQLGEMVRKLSRQVAAREGVRG